MKPSIRQLVQVVALYTHELGHHRHEPGRMRPPTLVHALPSSPYKPKPFLNHPKITQTEIS